MRLMIVLALLACAATAYAAGEEDPARAHYERGQAKYNIADFDAAIDEFKQSYELSKAPRLLFNIAQAYRLKKDWEHALYFYNTYLRNDPQAPNREDVESRIDEMKQKLDSDAHAPPPAPLPPPLPPEAPPPSATHGLSARRLEIAGLSTVGLGVVAVAVGGGLFGLASSDADKVAAIVAGNGVWNSNAQSIYDEGTHSQAAAIALVTVGGAAIGAGLVVTVIGVRKARRR